MERCRPLRSRSSAPIVSKLRRPQVILLVLLVVALLLRLWHLGNHLTGMLPHPEHSAHSSDIAAFATWAEQIAGGDWLGRSHFHPYMDWMEGYAPLTQFESWWGGKEIYHQNPLFPYLLAVSYLCSGGSGVPLLLVQVLMSTVSVWLVYDLGRRFLDVRAGLVAAGLLAVFGPSIVLDSILLRASLNSSLTLLSVWLLLRLHDRIAWRLALATGVCVALSFMLRPTGLALLLVGPLLLLQFAELRQRFWQWLPALVAGVVLVLGPFVVRNLIVGAPALAFSTRGPETVIQSHTRSADPGFMTLPPPAEFREYMQAGSASIGAALATSIESWPGNSLAWWLWHEWQKAICVFRDYEYPNNVNYYFYRRATPLLAWLPSFGWINGLGLVGLVLLGGFGAQRRLGLIALLALAALFLGCVLGFALGRYRLPLAVMMCIPAGATVSLVLRWLGSGAGRWIGSAVAALAVAALLSLLSFQVYPERVFFDPSGRPMPTIANLRALYERSETLRAQEFLLAARQAMHENDQPGALRVLESYLNEYQAFYTRHSATARKYPTAECWVYLREELRKRYLWVGEDLRNFGELESAKLLLDKAEAIRKQLEQMRGN